MVHHVNALVVSDYGLFSQDDDPSKGKWLEPARTLDFYPLKSGVSNYYSTTVGLSCFFHLMQYLCYKQYSSESVHPSCLYGMSLLSSAIRSSSVFPRIQCIWQ